LWAVQSGGLHLGKPSSGGQTGFLRIVGRFLGGGGLVLAGRAGERVLAAPVSARLPGLG
jgi:hypothetical protein